MRSRQHTDPLPPPSLRSNKPPASSESHYLTDRHSTQKHPSISTSTLPKARTPIRPWPMSTATFERIVPGQTPLPDFTYHLTLNLANLGVPNDSRSLGITYTNSMRDTTSWINEHAVEADGNPEYIGFDLEQILPFETAEGKCKTALIQMAAKPKKSVYPVLIYHICKSRTRMFDALKDLLQCREIRKMGVGIKEDAKTLRRDFKVYPDGLLPMEKVVELWHSKQVDDYLNGGSSAQPDPLGGLRLKTLMDKFLGTNIDKSEAKRLALEHWDCFPLRWEAVKYAARDAWGAVAIWAKIAQDGVIKEHNLAPLIEWEMPPWPEVGPKKPKKKKRKKK